ncbi:MAG: CAAX prenyl protease-related protein [Kiritimatiellae bacterium]|nr:CAAX prenyl protease-related protein [Kiritimatiellia bacterium]
MTEFAKGRDECGSGVRAALAMSAPYLLWIAFILVFQVAASLGAPLPRSWAAPAYALKSALCLALLLLLRHWTSQSQISNPDFLNSKSQISNPSHLSTQHSSNLKSQISNSSQLTTHNSQLSTPNSHLPTSQLFNFSTSQPSTSQLSTSQLFNFSTSQLTTSLFIGILVFILWVAPECRWLYDHCRPLSLLYHRWLVMPLGAYPEYFTPQTFPALSPDCSGLAFSPAEAGWPLAIARLLGSAFVIAPAEELFFRGFLYRWIQGRNWRAIDISKFDAHSFWIVVAVFAFEHDRWLMGAVAGIAYGLLAIKCGGLRAAIVAHITTNLLLGIYVLVFSRYGFW